MDYQCNDKINGYDICLETKHFLNLFCQFSEAFFSDFPIILHVSK